MRNSYQVGSSWESNWAENNSDFTDLILADIDGDGKDEIYGIKSSVAGDVFKFANGDSSFASYPKHGTVIVIK